MAPNIPSVTQVRTVSLLLALLLTTSRIHAPSRTGGKKYSVPSQARDAIPRRTPGKNKESLSSLLHALTKSQTLRTQSQVVAYAGLFTLMRDSPIESGSVANRRAADRAGILP